MDSLRLYQELEESGDGLIEALAEAAKASALNDLKPNAGGHMDRWKKARGEVVSAARDYAVALQKYRQAVLADADQRQASVPSARSRGRAADKPGRTRKHAAAPSAGCRPRVSARQFSSHSR